MTILLTTSLGVIMSISMVIWTFLSMTIVMSIGITVPVIVVMTMLLIKILRDYKYDDNDN